MIIKGFTSVNYTQLQRKLQLAWADYVGNGGTEFKMADILKVKTNLTVRNAFKEDAQKVSDQVLTKIMKSINFNGFVLWENGVRYYYVKK